MKRIVVELREGIEEADIIALWDTIERELNKSGGKWHMHMEQAGRLLGSENK